MTAILAAAAFASFVILAGFAVAVIERDEALDEIDFHESL